MSYKYTSYSTIFNTVIQYNAMATMQCCVYTNHSIPNFQVNDILTILFCVYYYW